MEMVWRTNGESRNRLELPPDEHDIALAESFASYQPKATACAEILHQLPHQFFSVDDFEGAVHGKGASQH